MNAPFDPVGVAEAAMRIVEGGEGPLILSPGAPLESARQLIRRRYTQLSGRTVSISKASFTYGTPRITGRRAGTKFVPSSMTFWTAAAAWTVTPSWYIQPKPLQSG